MKLKDYIYHEEPSGTIYFGDCLEILPLLDKVDLVLTDPPYGIDYDRNKKHKGIVIDNKVIGDNKPFNPEILLKYNRLILWGANCYSSKLSDSPTWIVWEKSLIDTSKSGQSSDFEMAWSNCIGRSRIFRYLWAGCYRQGENNQYLHPTQKPEALMKFCISLDKSNPQTILDPFLGSGTTAVAAKQLGRKFIGIEISEKYCEIARQRLAQEQLAV